MDKEELDKDIEEKIKNLEGRLSKFKKKEVQEKQEYKQDQITRKQSRAGSEFLASVVAGGLLGFGVDYFFDSAPLGILFFMLMGFISGVFRANAATQKNLDEP
ncbi:MAG: AtpZ/AtpI family protein [Alphaproteobacteria bacterium]|nr:AtpZ/AtpI family protein [Alphaproteobacteria bacterium]